MLDLQSDFKDFDITQLVAVSKKQEDFKIDLAIEYGHKIFGENRVQEAEKRWQNRVEIYVE